MNRIKKYFPKKKSFESENEGFVRYNQKINRAVLDKIKGDNSIRPPPGLSSNPR